MVKRKGSPAGPSAAKSRRLAETIQYDSEEEPSAPQGNRFYWRLDPEESFSDWTIQIATEETDKDGQTKAKMIDYHVHKSVLGVGAKKCEYFARLFHGGERFSESQTSVSKIELHPLAAEAFPTFLDYVYTDRDGLEITTENAAALHHLGQYFENHRLQWKARQFWRSDMSMSNVGTYYQHGKIFHNERILQGATELCISSYREITVNYQEIPEESSILETSDPQFWLNVVKAAESPTLEDKQIIGFLVAIFCWNCEDLDAAAFGELTKTSVLPEIHYYAALFFLAVEQRFTGKDENPSSFSVDKMTDLQKRCIESLKENWYKMMDLSDDDWQSVLCSLDPGLLAYLLRSSIDWVH